MVFSKLIPKRGHYGQQGKSCFHRHQNCLLTLGGGLHLLGMEVKENWHLMPVTVCFVLGVVGKLSLLYSPNCTCYLGNTSKICVVLPLPFSQPQGKQILIPGTTSHSQMPYPLPRGRKEGWDTSEFEPPRRDESKGLEGGGDSCLS